MISTLDCGFLFHFYYARLSQLAVLSLHQIILKALKKFCFLQPVYLKPETPLLFLEEICIFCQRPKTKKKRKLTGSILQYSPLKVLIVNVPCTENENLKVGEYCGFDFKYSHLTLLSQCRCICRERHQVCPLIMEYLP